MLLSKHHLWADIESITKKMLTLAEANRSLPEVFSDKNDQLENVWFEISGLDLKRRQLLESFFSEQIDKENQNIYKEKIERLLDDNKIISEISASVQKNIINNFSMIGCQQQAAIAYGNIQASL